MYRLPGYGFGAHRGGDWLSEPGAMASLGLVIMIILLLWTIGKRRTLKGALQFILIGCAITLPLIAEGDQFGIVHWVPYLITGLGVLSFFLARFNQDMDT